MLSTEKLKAWIEAGIQCDEIAVEGDGHHFEAIIISHEFEGLSRMARQKKVNTILKPYFDTGELHALSMKTLTSQELKD